jgi:hypothetical protein
MSAFMIGEQRLLCVHAQQRAVRDDAVQAVVGRRRGDDDHLALCFGQRAGVLQQQRVVPREERARFVGAVREREEHVRHEAGLGLHLEDARAQVVGQRGNVGDGEARDRCGHYPVPN